MSKKLFSKWLKVFEVEMLINGNQLKREVVTRKNTISEPDLAVAGLLYDTHIDIYYLVKQYRPGAGEPLIEVMAGLVDYGEETIDAFKREAMEEVGFEVRSYEKLGKFHTSPGSFREEIELFIGFGSKTENGGGVSSEQEGIEIIEFNSQEIANLLSEEGSIKDIKTQYCLLKGHRHIK